MTLSRNPIKPQYLNDETGKIVYLSGFHNWQLIQDRGDRPDFDFQSFIQFITENNMNLTRSWVWFHTWRPSPTVFKPLEPYVYLRTGPGIANDGFAKTDLTKLNEQYFSRLRERVIELGNNGIYIAVMLFNSTSFTDSSRWTHNIFNIDNNINGIDGDLNNNGICTEIYDYQKLLSTPELSGVLEIHENYIKKVIDTLNDLDNVIWDIGNSLYSSSIEFINYFIDFIRDYESTKPKQHVIGFNALGNMNDNTPLFDSTADWVSPYGRTIPLDWNFTDNPPINNGNKVVISDTDNLILPDSSDKYIKWAWKTFTRGHHPLVINIFPGDTVAWAKNPTLHESVLIAASTCGYIRHYANKIDLENIQYSETLSSTRYAMYNTGKQYLIYQPDIGNFTINIQGGIYNYEIFNPITGNVVDSGQTTIGEGIVNIINPISSGMILYLEQPSNGEENLVPQNEMSIVYVDSEELIHSYRPASNILDGNPDTIWHTEWIQYNPDAVLPHEVQIDLGNKYEVKGFRYLPRQDYSDGGENGMIKNFQFFVSDNTLIWGPPVATGEFPANKDEQEIIFPGKVGRYVRMVALSEINDLDITTVAEINIIYGSCEGVVCEPICIGSDLWSQTCNQNTGSCEPDNMIEQNSDQCGYDPCEGVVCDNICDGNDLWSQKCVNGNCIPDKMIDQNSDQCGYDLCEGVFCDNICIGKNLYSQKCDPATGTCVTYQLIESNSELCGYDPCEGVVCPNVCVGNDLWSQRCDPDTGKCVLNQLIDKDSINCKIPDKIPSDETTIQNYLILGGIGIIALSILMASRK